MYYKLNDVEIRGICKERLESLEYETYKISDVYDDFLDEFNTFKDK